MKVIKNGNKIEMEEEIMYYVVNNFGTVEFSGTYNECKEYSCESCYTGLTIVNEAELDRFVDNGEEVDS